MATDPRYNQRQRPWPGVPREGSAGEAPIQSRRPAPPPEPVIVERDCYRDSGLLAGREWPITKATVISLATTQTETIDLFCEVPTNLLVQVYNAGTLDIYIHGLGQRVGTDLPHFRVISHPIPYVIPLSPGKHRFELYASGAVQASLVPIAAVGRG